MAQKEIFVSQVLQTVSDTSQISLQKRHALHLEKGEDAILQLELALRRIQERKYRLNGLPVPTSGQTIALVSSKERIRPWDYIRMAYKLCKALVVAAILWICIIGQPMKLVEGLYQGFVHGWSSQCKDGFKCDH